MIDISVQNMNKYFGDIPILLDINFEIYEGRHVGLVGKNGSGKTTLFRILTGEYDIDEGTIVIPEAKKLGILAQTPDFNTDMTVENVLRTAFIPLTDLSREMKECENLMADENCYSGAVKKYGELSAAFEAGGGYETEVNLGKVCTGLNINMEMLAEKFSLLSGGEQTRVNLGRLILENTDILLLDEPTNHLDMNSVRWLEDYIGTFKGTVVVVSHDRYFLDRTTDMTIELERLHCAVYNGNYSFYISEKEAMLELMERKYEKEQREIERLEFTAKRMHGWGMGSSKMMKHALALEKRIERIKQTEKITREKSMTQSFKESDRSGNDVCYIRDLTKSYGSKKLFSDVTFDIKKDESIALIGDNGSGKTTLLKVLLGEEIPDSGRVRWGSNVKIAYLPQLVVFSNTFNTVLDETVMSLSISPSSARNRLGSYHFKGDDVFKLIGDLSGGEKSRLRLCILMYSEINLLILDEPTNHLDIASCEWIEDALDSYEGSLLFVSHDRYFINRFATRIIELDKGEVRDFTGVFSEYQEYLKKLELIKLEQSLAASQEKSQKKTGTILLEEDRRKKADIRRLNALERNIALKENEIKLMDDELVENSSNHTVLLDIMAKQAAAKIELDRMYAEWEEMSSV